MKRRWLGYASALFLLLGGVLQVAGGNLKIGILFIVLSIVSVFLQVGLSRRPNNEN
jgi:hypothetical protein